MRKGKTLKANLSASNTRLFVGNIPKPKDMEEIMEEFSKSIEGITEVIISVNDEMAAQGYHNKGYTFLEFGDHKTAATAKKKLENTKETVSVLMTIGRDKQINLSVKLKISLSTNLNMCFRVLKRTVSLRGFF